MRGKGGRGEGGKSRAKEGQVKGGHRRCHWTGGFLTLLRSSEVFTTSLILCPRLRLAWRLAGGGRAFHYPPQPNDAFLTSAAVRVRIL